MHACLPTYTQTRAHMRRYKHIHVIHTHATDMQGKEWALTVSTSTRSPRLVLLPFSVGSKPFPGSFCSKLVLVSCCSELHRDPRPEKGVPGVELEGRSSSTCVLLRRGLSHTSNKLFSGYTGILHLDHELLGCTSTRCSPPSSAQMQSGTVEGRVPCV